MQFSNSSIFPSIFGANSGCQDGRSARPAARWSVSWATTARQVDMVKMMRQLPAEPWNDPARRCGTRDASPGRGAASTASRSSIRIWRFATTSRLLQMSFSGGRSGAASGRCAYSTTGAMYRRAGEIFKELKSETPPRNLVRQMSGGQRQAVANRGGRCFQRPRSCSWTNRRQPFRYGRWPRLLNLIRIARPGHRRRADQPP